MLRILNHVRAGSTSALPPGFATFDGNVSGSYTKGGLDRVTVSGSWGTITDPGTVVTKMGAIANAINARATWPQPLTGFDAEDPHDSGAQLSCGVVDANLESLPICIWADHSTAGTVTLAPWLDGFTSSTMTLAQAAEQARGIRDAMTTAR